MVLLTSHPNRTGHPGVIWAARIIGLAATLMWTFVLVASAIDEGIDGFQGEGAILAGLILIAVTGVLTAFFNEEFGGTFTLVAGIALSVFAVVSAGRNHWLAVIVSGVPFVVAGVLFLIGARIQRN